MAEARFKPRVDRTAWDLSTLLLISPRARSHPLSFQDTEARVRLDMWPLFKQTRVHVRVNSTSWPPVALGHSAWEHEQLLTGSRQSSEFTSVYPSSQALTISDPKWPLTGWCFTPALAPKCCRLFPNLRTALNEWKCATTESIREKGLQVREVA